MRIVFMGTPQAAVPTLRQCVADGHEVVAVWTQPDRPAGRGNKLRFSPVKEFALSQGIEVFQPARVKNEEAKQLFASHDAEVAVVVAYGRILPEEFLRAPQRGCINVHFSLLPLYRGAAPANWAIVNGERETGVTTMFIEPTLDTGPILLQSKTQIGETETAPELMERLAEIGASLLGETLARLSELTPRPQHDRDATFAPMLKKEDGLIVWSTAAVEIERRVRGLDPWPGSYTHIGEKLLKVHRVKIVSTDRTGEPGEVVRADGGGFWIASAPGVISLEEVQLENKKRLPGVEFIKGARTKVGDRLA